MLKAIKYQLAHLKQADRRWLFIWCFIYVSFLLLDIFTHEIDGASILKYIGIFLCLIYAYQKFRQDHLLILALLFTLLADTVLVWTPHQILGVFAFCFAQFFHLARFTKAQPKSLNFYFAAVFLVFIFGVLRGISPIYAIAAIYAFSLATNLILSIKWRQKEPDNFYANCAALGFILFICCDLCVGMQFLSTQGILPATILPVVSFLVWFFYYPSQVLISNSSTNPN